MAKVALEMAIILPEKISTNEFYRLHKMQKHAVQQEWYQTVLIECRNRGQNALQGPFPLDFEYTYHLTGKRLDTLNTGAMTKMIEDGLKMCGVIPDDSPKYVRRIILQQDRSTEKYQYVVVRALVPVV